MANDAIDFDGWVKYLFDHPVTDPAWYWEDEGSICLPPEKFIAYGTRLFSKAGDLLAAYSDGQVNDGLHRVISNSVSDEIFALKDSGIPLRERVDFLRGIFLLNRQCFNARCTAHLSHLDRESTPAHVSPLNGICYMWWDIFILYGNREDVSLDPLNRACIDVMAQSLALSNIAVLEGALHGLGHFSVYYPDECRKIIEAFLSKSRRDISAELAVYAENAKVGGVL